MKYLFIILLLTGCVPIEETPINDLGISEETVIQCRDSQGKFVKCPE